MAENMKWDSPEAFQLRECYDLAARFETQEQAKAFLQQRAKKIRIPKDYTPIRADAAYPESVAQAVSEITERLAQEGFLSADSSEFAFSHRISQLPDSGEKEYFLALLALRGGTNESSRANAMRHLSAALSHEPDDPRYTTLAAVLQEVSR